MQIFSKIPRLTTRQIAVNAVIAALYFVLSYFLQPFTFGIVQLRVAEFMTILPLFSWTNIIGLTIGCLITNLFSPFGVADVIIGTAATLIAGCLTYRFRKNQFVGAAFPVLINALLLPLMWLILGFDAAFFINVLSIFISQAVIVYGIGIPVYYIIRRTNLQFN
ncbi:MAG: QueT transporter family protein [Clostridiales bacterium]|nr:QueT transporter family protein [Clostridiales bacterium]